MIIAIFDVLNACFIVAIKFPPQSTTESSKEENGSTAASPTKDSVTLKWLVLQSQFFVPCAVATFLWGNHSSNSSKLDII